MPLTKKGQKIKAAMVKGYGSKKLGERVFYAAENKGTIKGVAKKPQTGKKKWTTAKNLWATLKAAWSKQTVGPPWSLHKNPLSRSKG
jgi:DNA-directed RNA polymerase